MSGFVGVKSPNGVRTLERLHVGTLGLSSSVSTFPLSNLPTSSEQGLNVSTFKLSNSPTACAFTEPTFKLLVNTNRLNGNKDNHWFRQSLRTIAGCSSGNGQLTTERKPKCILCRARCTTAYDPGQMAGFSEGLWGVTVGAEAVRITSPLGPYTQP